MADIYFAQSPAGSNNGTNCANAFSITDATHGINVAGNWVAGNTLHICGTITIGTSGQAVVAAGSGSSGNPITLKFETGADITSPVCSSIGCIQISGQSWITVDGGTNGIVQNTANGTGLANHINSKGVYLAGVSHVTVKNLTVANICQHTSPTDTTGCQSSGVSDAAIKVDDNGPNSSFITITQNTIHDSFAGVDVFWNNTDHDIVISNNTVSRCNWALTSGGIGTLTNLSITNNDLSCVVAGGCNWNDNSNQFHHNGMIIDPGQNALISGLVVANNFIHDVNPCTGGVFIDPSGNGDTPNAQIYNNVFFTTAGQAGPQNAWITLGEGAGAGAASGVIIINNTILGPGIQGVNGEVSPTIKNNIISGVTYGEVLFTGFTGVASDYNDFFGLTGQMAAAGTIYNTVADWTTATGLDVHSITSNPNLTTSFIPNTGSPVISAGINLASLGIAGLNFGAPQTFGVGGSCGLGCLPRSASNPWDMGAYPFAASPPVPTAPTGRFPLSLVANPVSIVAGQSSTLTLTSGQGADGKATSCTGPINGVNGSAIVSPAVTTTYTQICNGVDNTGASVNGQKVSVTVAVTPAPPSPYVYMVSPTAFSFSGTVGFTSPACQTLTVDDTTPSGPLPSKTTTDSTWLTVTPTTANTKFPATVCVNIAGLAAGTYNGHVIITETAPNSSGQTVNNSPLSVPVSLVLVSPPKPEAYTVAPTSGPVTFGQAIGFTFTLTGPVPKTCSYFATVNSSGDVTLTKPVCK